MVLSVRSTHSLSIGWVHQRVCSATAKTTSFSSAPGSARGLAVATDAQELIYLNELTGDVIRRTSVAGIINQLHFSHSLLLTGSSDGYIRSYDIRNPSRRTDSAENSVYAHAGGVQGLQNSGNYVYSIGWGYRWSKSPRLLGLWNLTLCRGFKAVNPIPGSACKNL